MSTLIAISFDRREKADALLSKVRSLEKEYLLELEDAVIAERRADGKVKLTQSLNLVSAGAVNGAWWGALVGLIFTGPLGMLIVGASGAAFGALGGTLVDYGIDDSFIRELGQKMDTGSTAVFFLIRRVTEDKALEELRGMGGTILKTNLSNEDEDRLRAALSGEGTAQAAGRN